MESGVHFDNDLETTCKIIISFGARLCSVRENISPRTSVFPRDRSPSLPNQSEALPSGIAKDLIASYAFPLGKVRIDQEGFPQKKRYFFSPSVYA